LKPNAYWMYHTHGVGLNPAVMFQLDQLQNLPLLSEIYRRPATEKLIHLIKDCLRIDPHRRPKAKALVKRLQDINELVCESGIS
jgi:hypothetical protein